MFRRESLWNLAPIVGFAISMGVLALMNPTPLLVVIAVGASIPAVILTVLTAIRLFTGRVAQRAVTRDVEAYTLPWRLTFYGLRTAIFSPVSYALARVAVSYSVQEFPSALRFIRSTDFPKAFGYSGGKILQRLRMMPCVFDAPASWEPMRSRVEAITEVALDLSPGYVEYYLSLPLNGVDEAIEFMAEGIRRSTR